MCGDRGAASQLDWDRQEIDGATGFVYSRRRRLWTTMTVRKGGIAIRCDPSSSQKIMCLPGNDIKKNRPALRVRSFAFILGISFRHLISGPLGVTGTSRFRVRTRTQLSISISPSRAMHRERFHFIRLFIHRKVWERSLWPYPKHWRLCRARTARSWLHPHRNFRKSS
jgi:hypothetical protein